MFRRSILILCGGILALLLKSPVLAAEEGSLRIIPECCGVPLQDGEIWLYRVGDRVENGYVVTDGLADWVVWDEELEWQPVREWLLGADWKHGIKSVIADGAGAVYTGLEPGLYLVRQSEPTKGYTSIASVLLEIPEKNSWDLTLRPKVLRDTEPPKTADRPAPIIGAMGLGFCITLVMLLFDKYRK